MNEALLLVNPLRATVIWAKSGTNPDNWLAKQKKDLTPVMSFGTGKSVSTLTHSGSGEIPFELITSPAKGN